MSRTECSRKGAKPQSSPAFAAWRLCARYTTCPGGPSSHEPDQNFSRAGLGFVTTSLCRVIYVIDEADRFGFGYGTLATHVECGEERFMVERDGEGNVYYDVYSFSLPRYPLARLCAPVARALPRRFLRDSGAAMSDATLP